MQEYTGGGDVGSIPVPTSKRYQPVPAKEKRLAEDQVKISVKICQANS